MAFGAALLPQWRESLVVVLSEVVCESSLLFLSTCCTDTRTTLSPESKEEAKVCLGCCLLQQSNELIAFSIGMYLTVM